MPDTHDDLCERIIAANPHPIRCTRPGAVRPDFPIARLCLDCWADWRALREGGGARSVPG